jgi:hypothetical protein
VIKLYYRSIEIVRDINLFLIGKVYIFFYVQKEVKNMRYRKVDENGDMTFGKGLQNYTYGLYAVKLAIESRMKLLYSEWWEDQEEGLPLFEKILGVTGSPDNIALVDSIIKERITGTTDVTGIESFSSSWDSSTRTYKYTAKVNTKYGTTTVSSST